MKAAAASSSADTRTSAARLAFLPLPIRSRTRLTLCPVAISSASACRPSLSLRTGLLIVSVSGCPGAGRSISSLAGLSCAGAPGLGCGALGSYRCRRCPRCGCICCRCVCRRCGLGILGSRCRILLRSSHRLGAVRHHLDTGRGRRRGKGLNGTSGYGSLSALTRCPVASLRTLLVLALGPGILVVDDDADITLFLRRLSALPLSALGLLSRGSLSRLSGRSLRLCSGSFRFRSFRFRRFRFRRLGLGCLGFRCLRFRSLRLGSRRCLLSSECASDYGGFRLLDGTACGFCLDSLFTGDGQDLLVGDLQFLCQVVDSDLCHS